MADVRLTIAGRFYDVNTSDGQEQQLIALSQLVDEKARAVLGTTETRQLLFAALMLADELQEARSNTPQAAAASSDAESDALRQELAAAKDQIAALEAAAAEQAQALATAKAEAEAAKAAATKPAPSNGPALSALADRIEQLADKFEQLV